MSPKNLSESGWGDWETQFQELASVEILSTWVENALEAYDL